MIMAFHVYLNLKMIFIVQESKMENQIKILLVEDEFITAQYMKNELVKIGYNVTYNVSTGEEAIICAKKNPPDIILMDIRLAGKIDGIETGSIIKSGNDIKIIFMTGYEDEALREKADELNPLGYLIKPIDIQKIKEIIDLFSFSR